MRSRSRGVAGILLTPFPPERASLTTVVRDERARVGAESTGRAGEAGLNESIRLGRIAGVRIGVNWSVVAVFLLLLLGLAGGRFPARYPRLDTAAYVVAGVVAAVVFFVSLLAHEMAHALVARRNGQQVEGITLWLIGGVARLEGEADDPGGEMRMAAVGPAVSVLLALVFGAAAWIVQAVAGDSITVGVLLWLAGINGALAVFNLIPAAPLDGGRVLRAFLWRRRGDRLSATATAARAGLGFGWLLITLGLVEFVAAGVAGGLWLALIGWFLVHAAAMEEQHARLRQAVAGVTAGDVMTSSPETVPADLNVAQLLDEHLLRRRWSSYPVVDDAGAAAGLVTLARVKQVPSNERSSTLVRDIACSHDDVATASADEPLSDVLPRMTGCADGRVLVVDGDDVVGIVSPSDILRRVELAGLRADLARATDA